ncbi:hypothetical protein B0T19DRAFT_233222 [Cercophora scortea]|uniref:NAD(P)-binding domain-containing protein n=1 Tax=Cercophora scortea TaxID=314031 RepID=A0AAE0IHT5_9PEZI|nr:hypothetical protein B0T19DRAFT_233222 [Cercophora scortea]
MKIILTGATGRAGTEVLKHCIQHPSITSIIVLTRRPLPLSPTSPSNPTSKVQTILATNNDYLTYDTPEILQATAGAEACIWALGDPWADPTTARTISFDYPLAAARVFSQRYNKNTVDGGKKKFHFVYLSGGAVERDQSKKLWFLQEERKVRGQAELALLDLAKEHNAQRLAVYILKPGMFLRDRLVDSLVAKLVPSVRVDVLAKVLVETAVRGAEEDTLLNRTILEEGRKL